jgi:hypothetical protein
MAYGFVLVGNTESKYLFGLHPSRYTTQGGQPNGYARGVLDLADAMLLCQPEERFDLIRAYWHADLIVVEAKLYCRFELAQQIGGKIMAHIGGVDGIYKRQGLL